MMKQSVISFVGSDHQVCLASILKKYRPPPAVLYKNICSPLGNLVRSIIVLYEITSPVFTASSIFTFRTIPKYRKGFTRKLTWSPTFTSFVSNHSFPSLNSPTSYLRPFHELGMVFFTTTTPLELQGTSRTEEKINLVLSVAVLC